MLEASRKLLTSWDFHTPQSIWSSLHQPCFFQRFPEVHWATNSGGMISYLTMNVKGHYADHKNKLVLLPLTKCNESLAEISLLCTPICSGGWCSIFFFDGGGGLKVTWSPHYTHPCCVIDHWLAHLPVCPLARDLRHPGHGFGSFPLLRLLSPGGFFSSRSIGS